MLYKTEFRWFLNGFRGSSLAMASPLVPASFVSTPFALLEDAGLGAGTAGTTYSEWEGGAAGATCLEMDSAPGDTEPVPGWLFLVCAVASRRAPSLLGTTSLPGDPGGVPGNELLILWVNSVATRRALG